MLKINQRIEIVSSANPSLSSMSDESRQALRAVLAAHYSSVVITLVNNLADLEALVARKPDLVFLGMKFIPQNTFLNLLDPHKIWLGQYLEAHGISYTGSGHLAHRLELNKHLAKQRVLANGLKTSAFKVIRRLALTIEDTDLSYPLFVKPTNRGGGLGIDSQSVVHNFEQLKSKVNGIAAQHQSDSLVETYLPGREFSVAILKDEATDDFMVMPIELVTEPDEQGVRILSDAVKTSNQEVAMLVEVGDVRNKVCQLALSVFHALGARDYGRIDIRLDESGLPHFLEANLLPSLISGYGSFPKACSLNISLSYEAMVLAIVALALARTTAEPELVVPYPAISILAT